ncbi:N-acetyltransferase [Nitrosopumilus sp.]|nr:N-acetyltransferase [Nitrosopumilus sp.]
MEKIEIKFKKVKNTDLDFLYDLLKNRQKKSNISHKKMPTFLQHKRFVESKPYVYWYIILKNKERIGSVYITMINEIGLNLIQNTNNLKLEKKILDLLMLKHPKTRFLININPKNKKRINFLKNSGFNLIQYTFEFTKEENETD